MEGGVGGRADGSDPLLEDDRPVFRGDARRVAGQQDVGGGVGRQAVDRVVVDDNAKPDVLAEHLPEGVVARHDEEVGRIVRTGDDHLFGLRELGRLGGAAVDGRQAGRDTVAEAPPVREDLPPGRLAPRKRGAPSLSPLPQGLS